MGGRQGEYNVWRRKSVEYNVMAGGEEEQGTSGIDVGLSKCRVPVEELASIEAALEDWAIARHKATP